MCLHSGNYLNNNNMVKLMKILRWAAPSVVAASVLLPALQAAALPVQPDYPCFMRTASGRIINLTSMCQSQKSTTVAIESPKIINISLVQYNQIKKGMTYEKVVQILKSPGLKLSEGDTGMGFKSSGYFWRNLDDSFLSVDFNGGVMVSKLQKDLK